MTPREIMSKMFQIQGIKLDTQDIEYTASKILKAIGSGFGDGINTYDCFISYRVAADSDTAEKLWVIFKST